MKKNIVKILISTIVFILMMHISPIQKVNATGFGISPASIENDHVKPGSTVKYDLVVSRSNPEGELGISIETDAGDMNDWVTYEPGTSFTIPKGTDQYKFTVVVNVPANAEMKDYTGYIRIKAADTEQASEGVGIIKGTRIDLNLKVTNDDFVNLIVRSITSEDIEFGKEIIAKLRIENSGNVPAEPTAVLELSDLNNNLVRTLTSLKLDQIGPGETKVIDAIFENDGIEAGEYFGNIKVSFNEEVIREERLVIKINQIEIDPVSESAADSPELGVLSSILTLTVIAFAVVLVIFILFVANSRKKKK